MSGRAERYVLKREDNPLMWTLYKEGTESKWEETDISYTKDLEHIKSKLSPPELRLIKMVLASFAGQDGIVNENLAARFYKEIVDPMIRLVYSYQIYVEGIHAIVYSQLISVYEPDPKERDRLFTAMEHMPSIKKKTEWALKWSEDSNAPLGTRMLAFVVVEGVQFQGSFCIIGWFKKRNLCDGLSKANEWISRDEHLHCRTGIAVLKQLNIMPTQEVAHDMIKEAVDIEMEFVKEILPETLEGMNQALMSQYIKSVADDLLDSMGYSRLYKAQNPFPWMNLKSYQGKANFFEKKVSQYASTHDTEINFNEEC
jgi:ribonucleotide reductase beta subunit family protein with ferritin-like domain